MDSRVLQLTSRITGEVVYTAWIRRNRASGETVYVAAYSITRVPGHAGPCVKVVFPLPNGNASVFLKPTVLQDGALLLRSEGRRFGDPGFYFAVQAGESAMWVRYVRSFRESIRVFVEAQSELRTDHAFVIWNQTFMRLHYHLRRVTE